MKTPDAAKAEHLVLFGASVRAAAFSALRAGLRPWCADLFADADLAARCPVTRVPPAAYPEAFLALSKAAPPGPWAYTGGLENRSDLVGRLARLRPLWGNDASVLARARSPRFIAGLLRREGLPRPRTRLISEGEPHAGRWLVKPLSGAGGSGIHLWQPGCRPRAGLAYYYQEYVDGESGSATYVAERGRVHLLGVTRQLVGVPWLNAAPFHYCGSLSMTPPPALTKHLQRLGEVLVHGCGLRGLFGVDFLLRNGLPWMVEVNPRYTASVEVIEYGRQTSLLAWHRRAFDPAAAAPVGAAAAPTGIVGKAIVFARTGVTFPARGPWLAALERPLRLAELPAFADVPRAGERIAAGHPICTVFARADSGSECLAALQARAEEVEGLMVTA